MTDGRTDRPAEWQKDASYDNNNSSKEAQVINRDTRYIKIDQFPP